MAELTTDRLLLRQWRESDLDPFAQLNADPEVMRYFPAPLDRAQSDALAQRARRAIADRGWGLWAVEVTSDHAFIGFVGLAEPQFDAHFTPAVEVGWRLARHAWGHGYATEAARILARRWLRESRTANLRQFPDEYIESLRRADHRRGARRPESRDLRA